MRDAIISLNFLSSSNNNNMRDVVVSTLLVGAAAHTPLLRSSIIQLASEGRDPPGDTSDSNGARGRRRSALVYLASSFQNIGLDHDPSLSLGAFSFLLIRILYCD